MLVVGVLVLGVGGLGCGGSLPDNPEPGAMNSDRQGQGNVKASLKERRVVKSRPRGEGTTRAVAWHAKPVKGAKFLTLLLPYSWCGFRDSPQTQRIDIVERTKETMITAFVFFPKVEATRRSSCPQTRFLGTARVSLVRDAFRRVLYDGSTSPPAQRWPRVREVGPR